ncbi:hydantoinase/oxoprolinase N-terminal domain-containing protein [Reyranella sp.]|uniref:hydantoinase/oxoprolinase N-terminal domain-containing protein n=1 Tax=Reyranella sp. TaxID=1929291 RepID=UPI003D1188A7
MISLGIDVGGTNTDAVLIDGKTVLHAVKTATTPEVGDGIVTALQRLLQGSAIDPARIDAVMIGTTHFTNAVVQRRHVARVAAVRIGLPAAATLPPFVDWPADLRSLVQGPTFMIRGGHELDGLPIAPFDRAAMKEAAMKIRDSGVDAVGIASVFSPLNDESEQEAAEILSAVAPGIAITQSHQLGRIGLLARENVTLLNAALVGLAKRTAEGFVRALVDSGIKAPLYITQNDGTVSLAEQAARFPVHCFASGPTNSLRGAAFLSGLEDAMVVDIGGTTSDVGCLRHGFPREANNNVEVGGVRTAFRMPDLLSIGLGGGTLVDPRNPTSIGPVSVGYQLTERSLVFGGEELTCTDIAVAGRLMELGDRDRVARLDKGFVSAALARCHAMLAEAVDRMKTEAGDVPLIAVGGGCFLVPPEMEGVSEVVHVPHQGVANAVGAAIAQVSGEVDQVFQGMKREEALERAHEMAAERAVRAGAVPASLAVVDQEDIPLSYLPFNSLRVRVRVVGDIASHA